MKKYTKILLAAIIIILLGIGFWQFSAFNLKNNNQTNNVVQEASTTLEIKTTDSVSFDIADFIGKTALQATASKTKLVTNGEAENAFVTSINGYAADSDNHEFWELVINGSEAQVGAGSYIIQKGDSILWQIDTY